MINKILYVLPGFMAVEFRELMTEIMDDPIFDNFCEEYYRHVLISPKSKIQAPKKFYEKYNKQTKKVPVLAQKQPQIEEKQEIIDIPKEYEEIKLDLDGSDVKNNDINVEPVEKKGEKK